MILVPVRVARRAGRLKREGTRELVPPLIEREREIELLSESMDSARQGFGSVLIIEAPTGYGKSSLLRHAAALSGEEMTVASVRGGGAASSVDFGVALRLLLPLVDGLAPEERQDVFSGHARCTLPLIEGTEVIEPGASGSPTPLLVGLSLLTARLARGPLLMAVDDAHAVDLPTLSYLVHLEQLIGDLPIVLLIATRPAADSPRRRLLARLAATTTAARIDLRPLSASAIDRLVAARIEDPPAEFCAALSRVSGGNPFFAQELLREVERGELAIDDSEAPALLERLIPERLATQVSGRIAELPPGCERLCRAAAVLGDGASLAEVSHLAELGIERGAECADLLTQEEILVHREGLGFAHPLIRAAIEGSIPAGASALIHRRAAELFRRSHQWERLPRHLLQAPGDGAGMGCRELAGGSSSLRHAWGPDNSRHLFAAGAPRATGDRTATLGPG